ncbi:MAG TPA: M1 family metallopeptidase [Sandaracinaceae bacterium LLY-WYZ-13_1]|nr:M1 family metallopeptidase [Sandaracinaceae bacterium LLY-WYZ-13_1]
MARRSLLALFSFLVACGDGAAEPPPASERPSEPTAGAEVAEAEPPEGRLPSDVRPTRYTLTLAVDPSREGFTGVAEIDVRLPARQRVIYLHGDGLEVSEVVVTPSGGEGRPAEWATVDEGHGLASITPERPVGPGVVTLRITYGAPFDRTLEGLYRVEHDGAPYAFTQMEPLGARKAFPCFDEPSFKTPFDVTLVVPQDATAIANGPQVSARPTTGGMQRVRFDTTEPLPTYLVAFAVGPFDVVEADPVPSNDVRDAPIPLRGVAPRGQGEQLAHALEHTPAILGALERYFGIPYPFAKLDLIAVPDFAAGAMENAGAITFRSRLLLLGEDASVRQQRGFAYVTAHELAHQWFGNLVTMEWWDDLWLNEAFATWMETQTIEETFPQFEPQIAEMGVALEAMESDSLQAARRIRQPIETEHDIHNAFDRITYSKGNAVLAMFEQWLEPDVFRRGVSRYLREHAEGNATAEDLLSALEAEAERPARAPFESFLNQPGVPLVTVTPVCEDDAAHLELAQRRYLPLGSRAEAARTWQVPFCARYRAGGEERRACTLLTEASGRLALEGGCPDWVMPNAGGYGYYRWSLPPEALEALRRDGLDALTVREAMSFADSIEASFAAGRTPYADAMEALAPLASRDERALATAPMELVELALDRLLEDDEAKARARRWARRRYRRTARRLGWRVARNEDPETQLLRAEVLGFLAMVAEDPGVRREAARRGRAYVGVGEDAVDPDAVPSDLAGLAVRVAVQEGGEEVFDAVLARLRETTDPAIRGNLLSGLSAAREPALRVRLLGLTLDEDTLRVSEIFRPLMGQLDDAAGRVALWTWLNEHYDALATRMGPQFAGYLPYAGSAFCDGEKAAEVRDFFQPRVGATQGGPRNLDAAVESVELCAARVSHARESAAAFFAR